MMLCTKMFAGKLKSWFTNCKMLKPAKTLSHKKLYFMSVFINTTINISHLAILPTNMREILYMYKRMTHLRKKQSHRLSTNFIVNQYDVNLIRCM